MGGNKLAINQKATVDAGEGFGWRKLGFVFFEGVGVYLLVSIFKMENGVIGAGLQVRNVKRVR
jgi:hypothetical protein